MKTTLRQGLLAAFCSAALPAAAQYQARVSFNSQSAVWDVPVPADSLDSITFHADDRRMQAHLRNGYAIPFDLEQVESIAIEPLPTVEDKDPYRVFQLYITTRDGRDVTSKEAYTDCHVLLNGGGSFSDQSLSGQIRCRGNSSLLWYDKKPFRLKLAEKHKLLGLDKAKSWVLLANYRDVTDLMNTFVFEAGRWMGLPYTNHTRYVELFVNGDYRGLYQLTEQVQQNSNRVAVSKDGGILIALDVDDGPELCPDAQDNFTSEVFHMPVSVKFPDDEYFTPRTVDSVRTVLAGLEQAIRDRDYERTARLLDIPSFIKYLQLQELVYNVELSAPRSVYMHKDGDGPWVMGPLWDFDAGYDFDWSDMYTGHTFFTDYRETVMGTNPLRRNGQYSYVPQFFTNLFGCPEFVEQYKAHWLQVKDRLVSHAWQECMKYVEHLRQGAVQREQQRWPVRGKDFDTELEKMHQWLLRRADFMTTLIANIPVPDNTPVAGSRLCGTLTVNTAMDWHRGYDQRNRVTVSRDEVLRLMGLTADQMNDDNLTIVPLNTDGSEGDNHTNGRFGAWFDADGNPGYYAMGHVYIEVFDNPWSWNCGLYQEQCWDDAHTVTLQLQYPHEGTLLKVNVEVSFTISGW